MTQAVDQDTPLLAQFPALPVRPAAAGAIRIAPLTHLSVIEAAGADTWTFLQSQLTQDVSRPAADRARLAGYCTAKGRLLASMLVWPAQVADDTPRALAVVDASLRDALVKRLGMFVLRAKVKLAPTELQVFGVDADDAARAALEAQTGALPRDAYATATLASGVWIAAPAHGAQHRWWWIADAQQAQAATGWPGVATGDAAEWRYADIAAGLPWIEAATQDAFIPQSVNLELIDGVSFKKGCYPGQEIVARSHYLGKVKRRTVAGLATGTDALVQAGADVYHSERTNEPVGRVVNVARAGDVTALLLETTAASTREGSLHLGAADGPVISLHAVPYPIPG